MTGEAPLMSWTIKLMDIHRVVWWVERGRDLALKTLAYRRFVSLGKPAERRAFLHLRIAAHSHSSGCLASVIVYDRATPAAGLGAIALGFFSMRPAVGSVVSLLLVAL
jgi:hypothetical protein